MAELSAIEQSMLELVNRARLDPLGEMARQGLSSLNKDLAAGTITSAPKQALAPNLAIAEAARAHSLWMLEADIFSHTGSGGSNAGERMGDAGYAFTGVWTWGENIAWKGTSGTVDPAQYILDEHRGLFLSAGHRANILEGDFREIGIGALTGDYSGYNALMTTQNFGLSGSKVFVTGVAYDDADRDAFYSVGEARAGIAVLVTVGADSATGSTGAAGGYAVGVGSGTAMVTFSGGGLTASIDVIVSTAAGNAKVDLVDGVRIETFVSATLGANATTAKLLGAVAANLTGSAAANVLTGNKVANTLDGGLGNDTLKGLDGSDVLLGGGGNDRLEGGVGADRLLGQLGNDVIIGGMGHDTITGGFGADTLTGGTQQDTFVFNAAPLAANADRITDFSSLDDAIWLEDAAFLGLAPGKLAASAFGTGSVASTAAERILYDAASGGLYFDRDGLGGTGSVKFAVLVAHTAVTFDDFAVI